MINFKYSCKKFIFILFFLVSLNISFAVCNYDNVDIKYKVGSLDAVSLPSSSSNLRVYVKDSFKTNPVEVTFTIKNDQRCFSSKNDASVRYFASGAVSGADSFEHEELGSNFYETFKFTFDSDITGSSTSFTPSFSFTNRNVGRNDYVMTYIIDKTPPRIIINRVDSSKDKILIKPNTNISFSYEVSDINSIKDITITGGKNSSVITNFTNEKRYTGTYSDAPVLTRTYQFRARDLVLNENLTQIKVNVDGVKPRVFLEDVGYSISSSQRKVSITTTIADSSFEIDDDFNPLSQTSATFSQITNNNNAVSPNSCERSSKRSDAWECEWRDLDLNVDSSKKVEFTVNTIDAALNLASENIILNIEVDNTAPKITKFELVNFLGYKNILNNQNQNSTVVLEFEEKNIDITDISSFLTYDFKTLGTINSDNLKCSEISSKDDNYRCNFKLSTNVFRITQEGNLNLSVSLKDEFSQESNRERLVKVDLSAPKIVNQYFEKDSSDIGLQNVLVGGERVSHFINFEEENFELNDDRLVVYSFSQITDINDLEKENCNLKSDPNRTNFKECEVENILILNNPGEKDLSAVVMDMAGNQNTTQFSENVLENSNLKRVDFIANATLLNPLERNRVYNHGANAWFEGKLNKIDPSNDISIINYNFKKDDCDLDNLNPIALRGNQNGIKFFPDNNGVFFDAQNPNDITEFNFKVEVLSHQNEKDMYKRNITCPISILKKDSTKLYAPELVNLTFEIDFYGEKEDGILVKEARRLKEMIEREKGLKQTFSQLHNFWSGLYQICSFFTNAGVITEKISLVFNSLSLALPFIESGIGSFNSFAGGLSKGNLFGDISSYCSIVTCAPQEKGATGFFRGNIDDLNFGKELVSGFCSRDIDSQSQIIN